MRFRSRSRHWLAASLALWACNTFAQSSEPLLPAKVPTDLDPKKVALGAKLFVDKRLSKDNTLACISCHSFEHGGADPRPRSVGVGGAIGAVNSPSIFNVGNNFRLLWNGSEIGLERQLDKLLTNPIVMATSYDQIISKLTTDAAVVAEFKAAYGPEGLSSRTVKNALVTYERSLVTPSRFDAYLLGNASAITADERRGYEKFKAYGCVACHQGVNAGGNMYQRFGALNEYFKDRAAAGQPLTEADSGLYNITKRDEDMHVFRVPSLRNVALTAPYFHDGSAKTLEAAVDVMFKYQLGRTAPAEDKALIVKFLNTLSGTKLKGATP